MAPFWAFRLVCVGALLLVQGGRFAWATTTSNCSVVRLPKTAVSADCPSFCVFERGDPPGCRERTVCDVPLNYSLPSPYGCPLGSCEVKNLAVDGIEGEVEFCGERTFESVFETLYWGRNGSYPFGYLFWNVLVALCVVLYLQFSPRLTALVVTHLVNGLLLDPKNEIFHLEGLSIMIIGGRAVLTGLEYLTPNAHIKCVELSINIKWWRGASDIRQSPSTTSAANIAPSKAKKLPFRMSLYMTGLEASVFNNTSRYNLVEEFVLRTIFKSVFDSEPPSINITGDAKTSKTPSVSRCSSLFLCCCRRLCGVRILKGDGEEGEEDKPPHTDKSPGPNDAQSASTIREDTPDSTLDPVPRAYFLFPITRIQCRNFVLYVGSPTLPTTLVVHVRTLLGLHYTEPIGDAPNKGLDSYRIVNKADLRGVTVSMIGNPGFVASEEMNTIRKRLEKKSVDAREVLSEILRNVKTSLNDVKIGMKDVRTDLGQTLGVQQTAIPNADSTQNATGVLPQADDGSPGTDGEVRAMDMLLQSMRNLASRSGKRIDTDENEFAEQEGDEDYINGSPSRLDSNTFGQENLRLDEDDAVPVTGTPADATRSVKGKSAPKAKWLWPWQRWSRGRNKIERENADQGTLLRSQLSKHRQTTTTYQTVKEFVTRPKKKGPRPVAEPDLLRTGKVELFLFYDQPGRITQKQLDSNTALPAPRQSLIVNIGGGDEDDETTIVYGPWADRQRALFQQHFFPFVFESQKIYRLELGKYRDALNMDVKVTFSRFAEVRCPYREQDLGLLMAGKRNPLSGSGDSGANEDSDFWFELQKKLQELQEEQSKVEHAEAIRAEEGRKASHLRHAAKEKTAKQKEAAESLESLALRDCARDGWVLCKGFSMDAFLEHCEVDAENEEDIRLLVVNFNAIAGYQAALVAAIPDLNNSVIPVSGTQPWNNQDRARWLWGEFAGREKSILAADDHQIFVKDRKKPLLERLEAARKQLPVPEEFQYLLIETDYENTPDLLEICVRELDDEKRSELERRASDPRFRLARWFKWTQLPQTDATPVEELDNNTIYSPEPKMSVSLAHHNVSLGMGAPSATKPTKIAAESYSGPIKSASSWNTSCGWVDISVNAGTTIQVSVPWYAVSTMGLTSTVNVELKKPRLYCSATRCTIAESVAAHLSATLESPLVWNGEQTYRMNMTMQTPRFRFLKTDIQALGDLARDWGSNSIEPLTVAFFIPAVYDITFSFSNAELLFNVNECNVVDLPEETADHNTYMSLSIPTASIQAVSEARSFQPMKSRFDVSVLWTGNQVFHMPVRVALVLPATHPRRSIPVPVGGQMGQGQGGATIMPDPVFFEMQRFKMDISYTYHHQIQDSANDILEADLRIDSPRITAYAEAMVAMQRFQQNYMGMHVCHISKDSFRACAGENFRTVLAYRNWYEASDNVRKVLVNDYEMQVRITCLNSLVFLPTILYPRATADGVLSNPEEDAITIFAREIVFETRMRDDYYAEYSGELSPFRIQVPGTLGKGRSDQMFFHETFMSRLGGGVHNNVENKANNQGNSAGDSQSNDAFTRFWLRGGNAFPQLPGTEVGQLVVNGVRVELQTLYGRAARDVLSPLVGYRTYAKASVGSIWGDLEIYQMAQVRDALATFDLMIARLNSFDRANGGSKDPALCAELPLGSRFLNVEDRLKGHRVSVGDISMDNDDSESGHQRRKSSMSWFGGDEEIFNGANEESEAKMEAQDDFVNPQHHQSYIPREEGSTGGEASVPNDVELEQTVFFRVEVAKAVYLPRYRTTIERNEKDVSVNANTYCQMVYGGQGFRSEISPNTNNPEWNVGYTFLAGLADHHSDAQDLKISVIDGSYGWKRKIGDVTFSAATIREAIRRQIIRTDGSLSFDGVYNLDGTHSHHRYHSRTKSLTLAQQQAQPKEFPAIGPFCAVSSDFASTKIAAVKITIRFFSLTGSVVKLQASQGSSSSRRIDQVFASASAYWSRDVQLRRNSFTTFTTANVSMRNASQSSLEEEPLGPSPGDLVLDTRVVAAREWRDRYISNAALHILQTHAMAHIAEKYSHQTVNFSSGPVAICVWAHAGDSFLQCSLSQCKLRADTLFNSRFSWKVSSEGREDLSFEIKHLKRSGVTKVNGNRAGWALVGRVAASFDFRAFSTLSDMEGEVRKQTLFLETHDHANRIRRATEALGALHSRMSVSVTEMTVSPLFAETLSLMPRVAPARYVKVPPPEVRPDRVSPTVAAAGKTATSDDNSSSRGSSLGGSCDYVSDNEYQREEDEDDDENDEVRSFASAIDATVYSGQRIPNPFEHTNEPIAKDARSEGGSRTAAATDSLGRDEVLNPSAIYVATKFATLPLEGPSDPYGASTVSLEPFLQIYSVDRIAETNDYWYGSAFGYANSGNLMTSLNSHQAREMGIAPSARTELMHVRAPSSSFNYARSHVGDTDASENYRFVQSSLFRDFTPVVPARRVSAYSVPGLAESNFETFLIRIHITEKVETMFTPASIVFAEDALHRMFPMAPTVSQMTDYFERNYLVLSPSPKVRLEPSPYQVKVLLSCAKGISMNLLHGSKVSQGPNSVGETVRTSPKYQTQQSGNTPANASSHEIVYATCFDSGPITLARRMVRTNGANSTDNITLDVSDSSLSIQVASAFLVGVHQTKTCFPVFTLQLRESFFVHNIEESESENHRSSSTSASFHGVDLMAGVDSLYVTYSVGLTWGDLLGGYSREGAAIWHRLRRQWALLAGQLLILSKMIDETDSSTADKEPRLGIALMAWCRSETPSVFTRSRNKLPFISPGTVSPASSSTLIATANNAGAAGVQMPGGIVPPGISLLMTAKPGLDAPASAYEDEMMEVPRAGWSTLVRTRRIACFLSEHHGVEERMRSVEIDRHCDVQPVVPLETVSGAKNLFPEHYFKESKHVSESNQRSRSASKEEGVSKVLVVELLRGVANRAVVRRKALGSSTIAYDGKVEGFIMRVLDSSVREVVPPISPLAFPAIGMRPAEILCMLVSIKPSRLSLVRHGKRGSSAKSEVADRRASDMQLRRRLVPTSITDSVRGVSLGFDCTTSPELILASRAGATVMAHYQVISGVRAHERKLASDAHRKEDASSSAPNTATATGRWSGTSIGPTPIVPASSIAYHTNSISTHRSQDAIARRTTLEKSQLAPLSTSHATSTPKTFSFSPTAKFTSERMMADEEVQEPQRANSVSLTRTRSFASSSHSAWDEIESSRSMRDLNMTLPVPQPERQAFVASGSFSGMTVAEEEKKAPGPANPRRRNRASFAALAGERIFGRTSNPREEALGSATEDPAQVTVENNNVQTMRTAVDVQRTISFDPNGASDQEAENAQQNNLASPANTSTSTQQPPQQASSATRKVVERNVSVAFDLHSANFCFTSTSLFEKDSANRTGAQRDKYALVTWSLDGFRMTWTRALSTAIPELRKFRDFGLLTLRKVAIKVEGGGGHSRKSSPWSVSGEMETVLLNILSCVDPGTLPTEPPQELRILTNGKRSTFHVPLYAIDNKEFQGYIDSWVSAFRLASEHAEVMRLGNLERTNSFQDNANAPRDPAQEAVSSLLALGLPSLAQQLVSPDATSIAKDLLMQHGVDGQGVWLDPFGTFAVADPLPEEAISRDRSTPTTPQKQGSPATEPVSGAAQQGDKPANASAFSAPSVTKRSSATSRITSQYQAVVRDRVSALFRVVGTFRMHTVEAHISPLETVTFISELEHLTLALDRKSEEKLLSMLYLGPSSLCLRKQNGLELTQALPSAWVLGNITSRQRSALKIRASERLKVSHNDDGPTETAVPPASSTKYNQSAVKAMNNDDSSSRVQSTTFLKVTVLVEAIRHSFTPSVIHQFLALQSGLKTEISLLLESIAKLSEERRSMRPVKPPTRTKLESEYSFFLQGISLRAQASSQQVALPKIWAELDTGQIELRMNSVSERKPLSFVAKVSDMRIGLLSSAESGGAGSGQPIHLFKLLSNLDLTNIAAEGDDAFLGALQTLALTIQKTSITIRPKVLSGLVRWRERYLRALELYQKSRNGLEQVDLYAKKVWENVTETTSEKDAAKRRRSGKTVTNVLRVIITDSSLIVPFVENGTDVSANVNTLKRVEMLGRSEVLYEADLASSPQPSTGKQEQLSGHAARLAQQEARIRRHSSGSVDALHAGVSFQKEIMSAKTRYVVRVEASEFTSSFITKGAQQLLSLRWIAGVVHKGTRCNLNLPEASLSFCLDDVSKAERQSDVMQRILVQFAITAPHIKCDRSVAGYFVGLWQTYMKPRRDDEIVLRVPGELSSWKDDDTDDAGHIFLRREVSGSFDEFEDDVAHSVPQEQTLFPEDKPFVQTAEAKGSAARASDEEERTSENTMAIDFSLTIEPGKCDFWGEDLSRSPTSLQANNDLKRQFTSKMKGPRHAMVAAQRAMNEIDVMQTGEGGASHPRRSSQFASSASKGSRSSNLSSNSDAFKSTLLEHSEHSPSTTSERLFVVDLPLVRFGFTGQGSVATGIAEVHSHMIVRTEPFCLSPTVVAFFEECILDTHSALSDYDATHNHPPPLSRKRSPVPGSDPRLSKTGSMDTQAKQKLWLSPKKATFTLRVTPLELSLKSSQDQPTSSLKLKFESGIDFVWSFGDVYWDTNQSLTTSLLSIPAVVLVLHELNPVFSARVNGFQIAFNRLQGVFDEAPLYTCLNTLDSITCFFSFWRMEALFALKQDWDAAWAQLLEERNVRKDLRQQQRITRQKSAPPQPQTTQAGKDAMVSSQAMKTSILRDPTHLRNIETFNRFMQRRQATNTGSAEASTAKTQSLLSMGSNTSSANELWNPSIILFVSTRVRLISFEECQLGVLASKLNCRINNIASRLALPGQLPKVERNPDPDTFYLTSSRIAVEVNGLYDGHMLLNPGCVLYVAREKPSVLFQKQDWQPWHEQKTTLNKTFFRCEELSMSLSRVLSGEKAKTKTHLLLSNISKISLQLRDDVTEDSVLSLDSSVECDTFVTQISVDAPPILTEASEQLIEQVHMARRGHASKSKGLRKDESDFSINSKVSASLIFPKLARQVTDSRASVLAELDPSTLRAYRAVGTIRVRFETFDLSLIHEPSNTAWGTTVQFLGARLICKKSADRYIMRDLTIQTGGADIFRYHGHHWKGPGFQQGGALSSGLQHAGTGYVEEQVDFPSSNESQDSDDEQPSRPQAGNQEGNTGDRPLSQEDAARRTTAARRAVAIKRGKKNIISFPKSSIVMVTKQHLTMQRANESLDDEQQAGSSYASKLSKLQPVVIYKFTSSFRDAISVSTDRREYVKLREIIGLLKISSVDPSQREEKTMSVSADVRQFQQSDDKLSFVLEPQLNIMGEATTAVLDWFFDENIQLKKNELPKQMHITVTDSLESTLATFLAGTSAVDGTFKLLTDQDNGAKRASN